MAIYAVTGSPGSGKSYYAVNQIKKILDSGQNCLILTNIAGLKIDDNRLLVMSFSQEGFASAKQAPYIRQLRQKYGLNDDDKIYYFIDEAQQYLSPRLRNDDVIYFFDTHRHYGTEIYLMSQNIRKIHKDITALCEYETRASALTINPLPGFFYRKYAGGEQFATFRLNKKNEIFALYQSMEAGTTQKKNKKYVFIVVGLVIIICVSVYAFMNSEVVSASASKEAQKQAVSKAKSNEKKSDTSKLIDDSSDKNSENSNNLPPLFDSSSISDMKDKIPSLPNPLPKIVEYEDSKDALLINPDTAGKHFISVEKFLDTYKPFLSGYSYYHIPHEQFVILSKNSDKVIFPKDRLLPHQKRVAVKSEGKENDKERRDQRSKISRAASIGALDGMTLAKQVYTYGARDVAQWYGVSMRYLQSRVGGKLDIEETRAKSVQSQPGRTVRRGSATGQGASGSRQRRSGAGRSAPAR